MTARSSNRCDCGERTRHGLPTCLGCHIEAVRREAHAAGFNRGLAEGEVRTWSRLAQMGRLRPEGEQPESSRGAGVVIDRAMWRRLLMVAHPDKHSSSTASLEATRWLLSIREQVMP